jgi:hypothetical protein
MSEITRIETPERVLAQQVVVDAPAEQLFAMLADPKRHGEIDGSGTVQHTVSGPDRLSQGAKFATGMKKYGFPYRITCTVTEFEDGRLIAWLHPMGHLWRWEFQELEPGRTTVTETWDYRRTRFPKGLELLGFPAANVVGIRKTLEGLRDRFAK